LAPPRKQLCLLIWFWLQTLFGRHFLMVIRSGFTTRTVDLFPFHPWDPLFPTVYPPGSCLFLRFSFLLLPCCAVFCVPPLGGPHLWLPWFLVFFLPCGPFLCFSPQIRNPGARAHFLEGHFCTVIFQSLLFSFRARKCSIRFFLYPPMLFGFSAPLLFSVGHESFFFCPCPSLQQL